MVEGGLRAYGFELGDDVREVWSKYRKSNNDGVFDLFNRELLLDAMEHPELYPVTSPARPCSPPWTSSAGWWHWARPSGFAMWWCPA